MIQLLLHSPVMYVYMYVCMYVCMHVCMYVRTHKFLKVTWIAITDRDAAVGIVSLRPS